MDRDCIEAAYCFFHQKWNVYRHSTMERQRDDIEYAVACYVDGMDGELYRWLAAGSEGYLRDHANFERDMSDAISRLEGA